MSLYQSALRLNALEDTSHSYANRLNHINRYQFAANVINQNFSKKVNILDGACGVGYGSHLLYQNCRANVTGIDIDAGAIKSAKTKYSQTNQIEFIQSDLCSPLKLKRKYQASVCFETIEHVGQEMGEQMVFNFYQSLSSGGLIIASTPNRYISDLLKKIGIINPYHLHEYYPNDFYELFNHCGFKKIKLYGQALSFPPTFYLAAKGILPASYFYPSQKLYPALANNLVLTGVK